MTVRDKTPFRNKRSGPRAKRKGTHRLGRHRAMVEKKGLGVRVRLFKFKQKTHGWWKRSGKGC